jgi:Na+/H+-dicarboxylate symporter
LVSAGWCFGTLKSLVPESVVEPFVANKVLNVVLLAVLVGLALRKLRRHRHEDGTRVGEHLPKRQHLTASFKT